MKEEYARQHNAKRAVMEGRVYWFHTAAQVAVLRK